MDTIRRINYVVNRFGLSLDSSVGGILRSLRLSSFCRSRRSSLQTANSPAGFGQYRLCLLHFAESSDEKRQRRSLTDTANYRFQVNILRMLDSKLNGGYSFSKLIKSIEKLLEFFTKSLAINSGRVERNLGSLTFHQDERRIIMRSHFVAAVPVAVVLFLATSCTTYHFGVKDRAAHVPDDFGQTEATIAQAEQSAGARYCPDKIAKAKELAKQGAEAYWACLDDEAARLMSEARKLAKEAEGCGPAPVAKPAPPAPPAPAPKPAPVPEKVCMTLKIEFDFNKADIKPKYHNVIAKVADFLKEHPETTAVIEGHTDNRGTYDYNIKLSERRAESVRKYLVEKFGIAPERLTTKGYGYTKPVASNKTAEGRQRNRRIDAMIDCVVYVDKSSK